VGIAPSLAAQASTTTHVFNSFDFAVHTILVGCYGTDAETCTRVGGPIQAVTTHDLPEAEYSRGYLITSLVDVRDLTSPAYINEPLTVQATIQAKALDANVGDLKLVRGDATSVAGDDEFSYLDAGGEIVAFPKVVELAGTNTHTGTTTRLWDTVEDTVAVDWLLSHLGSGLIGVSLDVHGLALTGNYGVDEAMFPVDGSHANGAVVFLTDKDDQDGDGYAAVSELRSNSNPILRSSTPYTDEDKDGYVNIRDIVGIVHEECLVEDASDQDWEACPEGATTSTLPGFGMNAAVPTAAFGPPEVTYYVEQILAAYSLPREGP
jgi:hypothetical protein